MSVTPPWSAHSRAGTERTAERSGAAGSETTMAAVTIATSRTWDAGDRVGPTTHPVAGRSRRRARPRRRVARVTYLRRRFAAALVVIAVVLVTAQAGAALGGSALDAPGRARAVAEVVVRPGDSLWSVAQHLAPGDDPRPVVDALAEARRGAPLLVGETVRWAG